MKYITLVLALFLVLITGCEKETLPPIPPQAPPALPEEVAVDKKGAAFAHGKPNWSIRVADLKPYWHYSWGNKMDEKIPSNVEYIPMFWGKGSVTDENLDRIKGLIADGQVKYVLGFNEPDKENQANMTVDEAIALWPRLEELGVPLGSPAPVSPTNDWITAFMQKAEAQNLRVDFMCVHSYAGLNVDAFMNKMQETYELYERPIWITEFAVADWNANSPEENRYSETQILGYMREILPRIYATDYIERFAWFNSGPDNAALAPSSLYDADDNLTTLGQYYASYEPNEAAGPGIEDGGSVVQEDPDNLLENGTFESGSKEPWEGFKSGILNQSVVEPNSGGYCARIENNDGSLFQVVTLESGNTYTMSFYSKWREKIPNTFSVALRQEGGAGTVFHRYELPKSADWTLSETEFTVPDSISTLRVLFYKPKEVPTLPPFYLDDILLKEKR